MGESLSMGDGMCVKSLHGQSWHRVGSVVCMRLPLGESQDGADRGSDVHVPFRWSLDGRVKQS